MAKRIVKHTIKWTWLTFALVIIVFAILMTCSRVMFVFADRYKSNIEQLAGQFFDHPIKIQQVHASWHGLQPVFKLRNISVLSADKSSLLSEVNQLDIGINVFDTLIHFLTRELTPMGGYAHFKNLTIPSRVGEGIVDGKLWFKIKHQKIIKAHAIIMGENIVLTSDKIPSPVKINHLKLHVAWKKSTWKGKFENLHIIYPELPKLENINGTFEIAKDHGKLHLYGKNVKLAYPKLFAESFLFKKALLNAVWKKNEEGWHVYSPSFALVDKFSTLSGECRIDIPVQGSPIINLQARASLNDANQFKQYIPHPITHPHLDYWLSHAFKAGKVTDAQMVLRGPLNKFPFDQQEGVFEIVAQFAKLDFHYKDDWSDLNDMFGEMVIDGRRIQINADKGNILGEPIEWIRAEIPNLSKPDIHVDGSIQMNLDKALEFVHHSPLEKSVGKELQSLALNGPMILALKLDIPLHDHLPVKVQGNVEMKNATLSIPQKNIKTKKLEGSFQFTEKDLVAKDINLELFDQPLKLSIKTDHPFDSPFAETQLTINGNIQVKDILNKYINANNTLKYNLKNIIEGESAYKATILLHRIEDTKPNTLILKSDLNGIAINMPKPLGKTKKQKKELEIHVDLTKSSSRLLRFHYGNLINGVADLEQGVYLKFGDKSTLPNRIDEGLQILGQLPELNIDNWYEFYSTLNLQSPNNHSLEFLKALNLRIGKLGIVGQQFNDFNVQMTSQNQSKFLTLNSPSIQGEIIIPPLASNQEMTAEFDYLKLSPLSLTKKKSYHPQNVYPINLVVHHLFYDKQAFGELKCSLTPENPILRINHLSLVSKNLSFSAAGHWREYADHHETNLSGAFHSASLGDVLKESNMSESVTGGNGQANFVLNWSNNLFQPSLDTLNGHVTLDFHDGHIVKLSKGTQSIVGIGRLLNVFSLQSLPKHLSSGFSDLNQEGFTFDDLKGDFVLKSGSAYTQNASIKGSVALVGLVGRIGYIDKDYDMKLVITPFISSSLPIVAALTGGPIAGVATFLAEPLFSKALNDITAKTYSLQGQWENPQIVKLYN